MMVMDDDVGVDVDVDDDEVDDGVGDVEYDAGVGVEDGDDVEYIFGVGQENVIKYVALNDTVVWHSCITQLYDKMTQR